MDYSDNFKTQLDLEADGLSNKSIIQRQINVKRHEWTTFGFWRGPIYVTRSQCKNCGLVALPFRPTIINGTEEICVDKSLLWSASMRQL